MLRDSYNGLNVEDLVLLKSGIGMLIMLHAHVHVQEVNEVHVQICVNDSSFFLLHILTLVQNSTHWSGLGEPQIFYSLAVSAFPVGEIVSSFAAACLSHPFPYFYNILFTCTVGGAGGLLYALAINGWMVVAARFLSGVCSGLGIVFTYSYIGRTVENCPGKGRNKKELLFLLYSAAVNMSYITATGKALIFTL